MDDASPKSAAKRRTPKGYAGIGHLTLGSDVLSLSEAILMPELVLGAEVAASIRALEPGGWYPIAMLLEPLDRLDAILGPSSLRRIGLEIFERSHAAAFRREASSARDIVHGIDGMYHRANRGTDIGGWRVMGFGPGVATLEKTTPHHCVMEEGILEAAFKALAIPAVFFQSRCFRKGDDACEYKITSHISDERWMGTPGARR